MPRQIELPTFANPDLSPEEFSAQWGADPVYMHAPNLPGDGYLFYNFSVEQDDPDFLRQSFRLSNGLSNSSSKIPTDSRRRTRMRPICKSLEMSRPSPLADTSSSAFASLGIGLTLPSHCRLPATLAGPVVMASMAYQPLLALRFVVAVL